MNLKVAFILVVLAELSASGCAARYGTKRRSNPSGAQTNENQNPVTKASEQPSAKDGSGPTAGIEVVLDGKVVSQVPKGKEVILRPTSETRDGDNPARSDCAHPGIVEAVYTVAGSIQLSTKSKDGCDKLEVTHIFTEAGSIPVEMKVSSDEGEHAAASTTVGVIDDIPGAQPEASLTISATPMEADIGQSISFSASCTGRNPPQSISWNFGNEAKADGKDAAHTYDKAGSFKVTAICKIDSKDLTATVTVLIKSPIANSNGGSSSGQSSGGNSGSGNSGTGSSTGGDDGSKTGSGTSTGGSGSTGGSSGSNSGTGSGSGSTGGGTSVPDEDDGGKGNPGQVGQNPAQSPNQN
jgi:PKD repeat protein